MAPRMIRSPARDRARAPRRGAARGLAELAVTALLALALGACAWAPVTWLASQVPQSVKNLAHTLFTPTDPAAAQRASLARGAEFQLVPGAPAADQLATARTISAAEPGAGYKANFPLWGAYDDTQSAYWDPLYATMCGPGAVGVALSYWPSAPNRGAYANVVDPLLAYPSTSSWRDWDNDGVYRMRGYITHLAFQVRAPGWTSAGMLPQSYDQSGLVGGATLQVVADTLNWEASGENKATWKGYFYATRWNSAYYNQRLYPQNLYDALHADIVRDITVYHTPVIVEVTAGFLPNWRQANPVNHFVAVTGYDDAAGTYTYLDTCKVYTGCNTGSVDGPSQHTIDQLQLAQGVANIATDPATGDGGWIW